MKESGGSSLLVISLNRGEFQFLITYKEDLRICVIRVLTLCLPLSTPSRTGSTSPPPRSLLSTRASRCTPPLRCTQTGSGRALSFRALQARVEEDTPRLFSYFCTSSVALEVICLSSLWRLSLLSACPPFEEEARLFYWFVTKVAGYCHIGITLMSMKELTTEKWIPVNAA